VPTVSISDTLDQLLALQGVDSGIQALEAALALAPKQLAEADEERQGVEAQVAEAKGRVDAILAKRRELEGTIESIGQTILKYETQKTSVKTNEEFHAINHQIAHEKDRRSGLEDEVLASFDEEEVARQKSGQIEAKLAEAIKRTDARKEELQKRTAADEARLAELREHRGKVAPGLEARVLSRYESLRAKKGGVAVAGVLGGTCGGCHSSLPPQLVNEVKKRDRMHHCEFCGRFLVHDPALDA
jgi:predicted  nucleic acid-binding Zn-ribbon protein